MIMQPDSGSIPGKSRGSYLSRSKTWLSHLIEIARDHMLRKQKKYQETLNKKVRPARETLHPRVFVFIRREQANRRYSTHKLVSIADGPYEVVSPNDSTVKFRICDAVERVSRDRIVCATVSGTGTSHLTGDPCTQPVQGTSPGDRPFFSQEEVHSKPPDDSMAPKAEGQKGALEFVISKIFDHGIDIDQSSRYCVQWYGHCFADDTLEPIPHLSRCHILRCHNMCNLPLPPEDSMSQAQMR